MSESIISIIVTIATIVAACSEIQKKLLLWRLSDEAKKYYTKKENKKFYKALVEGNMSVVDAIKAEKQKKIDEYMNKIKIKNKKAKKITSSKSKKKA